MVQQQKATMEEHRLCGVVEHFPLLLKTAEFRKHTVNVFPGAPLKTKKSFLSVHELDKEATETMLRVGLLLCA